MPSRSRTCQNCKREFGVEPADVTFYEKMHVPAPTWCPECRAVRRYAFWAERTLFRKPEALTGKEIFSTFSKNSPVTIYEHDHWWSDKWDPLTYGKEYDFSRSFFEQFRELMRAVPWPSRSVKNLLRSDYCNQVADLKDCYLCFNGGAHGKDKSENCLYGVKFMNMRNCMDFYMTNGCELCYEIFSAGRCYQLLFTIESDDSRNLTLCMNCDNCSDCFGCINLRHKQYYIWNEPHSKADYMKKIKEFDLGSYRALEEMKKRAHEFWSGFPMKYAHITHATNATGEYIYHVKNAYRCYQGLDLEDVRYSQDIVDGWDLSDVTSWGGGSELMYEAVVCGENCRNLKFCTDCWPGCSDLEYCMVCRNASDCFGCVGLKKKKYCILNTQYSAREYRELRERIMEHMNEMPFSDRAGRTYRYGEFFPPELSPLAYRESAAGDYFPLDKEKAEAQGYNWWRAERREFKSTIKAGALPDHIKDVEDGILDQLIECASCNRAYKIVKPELEFYRRLGLPPARRCPDCRYAERMKFRNPMAWWKRTCQCAGARSAPRQGTRDEAYVNANAHSHGDTPCPNGFETSYAPERPEIVYCESCYNGEVA